MAYRRKYKTGGRVLAADHPVESVDVSIPLDDPEASSPHADDESDNAVIRAAQATHRAEGLQRQAIQAQQPQTIEEHIDRLPGLSDRRKAFLKQNTLLLDPKNLPAIERYYKESQGLGIAADTDAEDEHILRGVLGDLAAERKRGIDTANAMRSEPMPDLARGAEPAPQLSAPRRTMPMTAPVSRQVPSASGRAQDFKTITLTGEQRLIARQSMSWLSPEEAERQYALNLRRMLQGKADGSIQ